jgi:uncharacterized protein YndB with AHSA1/START domain
MAPVVSTIEIDRPPEDVFAYATDLVRFGEWQNDVVRVEFHGGGPLGVGSRFTTTRQLGGVKYKTTQEVTEFSPPSKFAAASVGGPLLAIGTITIEPLDGGARSRFTSTLDFEGRGLGRLVPDGVRRMAAKQAPSELPEPQGAAGARCAHCGRDWSNRDRDDRRGQHKRRLRTAERARWFAFVLLACAFTCFKRL